MPYEAPKQSRAIPVRVGYFLTFPDEASYPVTHEPVTNEGVHYRGIGQVSEQAGGRMLSARAGP